MTVAEQAVLDELDRLERRFAAMQQALPEHERDSHFRLSQVVAFVQGRKGKVKEAAAAQSGNPFYARYGVPAALIGEPSPGNYTAAVLMGGRTIGLGRPTGGDPPGQSATIHRRFNWQASPPDDSPTAIVLLNDEPLPNVMWADETLGECCCFVTVEGDRIVAGPDGSPATEVRRGPVQIIWDGPAPAPEHPGWESVPCPAS